MGTSIVNTECHDVDGNILKRGDIVVALDVEDLENPDVERGQLMMVTEVIDSESNFVEFIKFTTEIPIPKFSFFGHRVLKTIG